MVQDLENEIWFDAYEHTGLYKISNIGRVKTLAKAIAGGVATYHSPEKLMKQYLSDRGYLKVILSKNGEATKYSTHRLLMLSAIGEHPELKEVNHKNGIKTDNRLSNLEWSNRSKNIKHSFEVLGRKTDNSPFKKGKNHVFYTKGYEVHNRRKVVCETLGLKFDSLREADKALGLRVGETSSYLKGAKNYTGLSFRYIC